MTYRHYVESIKTALTVLSHCHEAGLSAHTCHTTGPDHTPDTPTRYAP